MTDDKKFGKAGGLIPATMLMTKKVNDHITSMIIIDHDSQTYIQANIYDYGDGHFFGENFNPVIVNFTSDLLRSKLKSWRKNGYKSCCIDDWSEVITENTKAHA